MATKKLSKSHTSTRKKRSATVSSRAKKATASSGAKKAAAKATRKTSEPKPPKPKKLTPAQLKKRNELTQRIFDMAYEANQRGEFWRF